MFPFIDGLPTELKLSIIQKFRPATYVRFRRMSRFTDQFCEEHRRYLDIRPARPPLLFLKSEKEMVHFKISYSIRFLDKDSVFDEEMSKKNIEKIYRATSGFHFGIIFFLNYERQDEHSLKMYQKSLKYFMKAMREQNPNTFYFDQLSKEQIEMITLKWRPIGVVFSRYLKDMSILRIPRIRNASRIKFCYSGKILEEKIEAIAMARDREMVDLEIEYGMMKDQMYTALQDIFNDYKACRSKLRHLRFSSMEEDAFFHIYFVPQGYGIFSKFSPLHLGRFPKSFLNYNYNTHHHEKIYDYWLCKKADGNYGMLTLERKEDCAMNTRLTGLEIALFDIEKERLYTKIALILYETFIDGPPLDLSSIYEELKRMPIKDLGKFIKETRDDLIERYKFRRFPAVWMECCFLQ